MPAGNLGVDKSTISKDIKLLVRDSQKYLYIWLKKLCHLCTEYQSKGMQQILLECWARLEKTAIYLHLD